jgi:hypothetical protein
MDAVSFFNRVIGHDRAKRILELALVHPQHGYLLTGPDGVGIHLLAESFVRRLADEYTGESLAAHPDILILEREMNEKGTGYKKEISVQAIREFKSRVAERPTVASRLVIYVPDADYLNEEGVNALLKCIEEPAVSAVYVFAAHAAGKLPATLLSRLCQIRLDRVPTSAIESWLVSTGTEAAYAQQVASRCDGKPVSACRVFMRCSIRSCYGMEKCDTIMAGVIATRGNGECRAKAYDWSSADCRRAIHRFIHPSAFMA